MPPSILNEEQGIEYQRISEQISNLDLSDSCNLDKYNDLRSIQNALGITADCFAHSVNDGGRPIYLHPQLLIDFKTVEETIEVYCNEFVNVNL